MTNATLSRLSATLDSIRADVDRRGIEFFFAQFVDLYGRPSAKLVPAQNLDDLVEEPPVRRRVHLQVLMS